MKKRPLLSKDSNELKTSGYSVKSALEVALNTNINVTGNIDSYEDNEYNITADGISVTYDTDPGERRMKIYEIKVQRDTIRGIDVIYHLIQHEKKANSIDRIDATAKRDATHNGYYSLARYGFTETPHQTKDMIENLLNTMKKEEASINQIRFIKRLSTSLIDGQLIYTLMSTKEGREIRRTY